MDSRLLDTLLDNISELFESGADENTIASALNSFYDGFVGKFRPLLGALPEVSDQVAGDLAPILTAFIRLANETAESSALRQEITRFRELRARGRFSSLRIYEKSGFTHNEAMALVLADVASMKELTKNVPRSSSVTTKK